VTISIRRMGGIVSLLARRRKAQAVHPRKARREYALRAC